MPEDSYRHRGLKQLLLAVTVVAVICGALLLLMGFTAAGESGPVLMVGGLLLAGISLLVNVTATVLFKMEAGLGRLNQTMLDELDLIRRMEPMVKTVSDNSQISDITRSLANRERERDALRQAIREDMYKGDWESANLLADQMEKRLGYAQDAKALREEMASVREMTIEEKIGEAVSHIEKMMDDYNWSRARAEMERLMKLFPRHERVTALPAELNRRRAARKQQLLTEWNTAVQRDEIDRGISLLAELDQYLSREEAQQLADSARHVFKARLLNLGVQFSLAVAENRWRDALEIGLQIREEFPNSRMAKEVGEKMEVLRMRAGFVTDVDVVQQSRGQAPPTPPSRPA